MIKTYKEIDKYRAIYYIHTPLYYKHGGNYVLYKKAGDRIPTEKLLSDEVPKNLYISKEDLEESTEELFNNLEEKLKNTKLQTNKVQTVKVIEEIVDNLFLAIDEDSMSFATKLVKEISTEIIKDASIAKEFTNYTRSKKKLIKHSTRVFFFSLVYSYYTRKSETNMLTLALSSLFHAIGKTKIPEKILENRQLSDEEYSRYKEYPELSYKILKKSKDKKIKKIAEYVYSHKETEDGTGYPRQIVINSEIEETVGIIDSFEQLTSADRKNKTLFEALSIIKQDVESGKYDKEIFENFVKSLGEDS